MGEQENLEIARELSEELGRRVKGLVSITSDYDLERLLKKIEAQVIDIQHNLKLACRITGDDKGGKL